VRWSEDAVEPKWRSALLLRRVSEFDVDGFAGRQGLRTADQPAVLLDECENGTMRNARALDGCRRLVQVRGRSPGVTVDAATRSRSRGSRGSR
jgi:hypothetical protein